MKVQKLVNEEWQDYQSVIDSNYLILSQDYLDLAMVWDAENVVVSESGSYRIYTAVVDSRGNVLSNLQGRKLESFSAFNVN